MANELELVFGTQKTLEASGASIANNAIGQADDASFGVVADGGNFPHARFVLAAAFATAPAENSVIALYARPLNIDGTNDSDAPEVSRGVVFIGSFVLNNVTTTQYLEIKAYDVPWEAEYYLHNSGSGQSLSSGWTLKVTPFSFAPGA